MGTTSLLVHRDELGLPPLQLQDPAGGFEVDGVVSFGGQHVERTYAPTVPWVDYERIKHIRRTNGTYSIAVVVSGATSSELTSREDTLIEAFSQIEFVVQHIIDGAIRSWTCMTADMDPGDQGEIDENWHSVGIQVWRISGPHRGRAA